MMEAVETGVGLACGGVWGRAWSAIGSTGQRHRYLREEEEESETASSRFRVSSGIGTEEHI